jgi:hypothetical protein
MSKKARGHSHVKLPCLQRIEVENYPLFTDNWSYPLQTGLNFFLGVNGVGKTTATNLIIYGLIGYREEIPNDYFKNRIEAYIEAEDIDIVENPPMVKLEFTIGNHVFKIQRHILKNYIQEFSIDKKVFTEEDSDEIDKLYTDCLLSISGLDSLADFAFLLQYFLIRVEEGNYLLWDDKGGDQARLIRLLINQAGFEKTYKEIAKKVKDWDSKVRGTMYTRSQLETRRDALKVEREADMSKNKVHISKKDVEAKLTDTKNKLEKLKNTHGKATKHLGHLRENIYKLNADIEKLAVDRETASDDVASLESRFYKHVYSNNKVLLAVHKLNNLNQCIYCGNSPKASISQAIIKSVDQCKCPVCESKIDGESEQEEIDDDTLEILEAKRTFLKKSEERAKTLETERAASQGDFDKVLADEKNITVEMSTLSIEIFDFQLQLSQLNNNPEQQISKYDSDIKALERQIDEYNSIVAKAKTELEAVVLELQAQEELQNSVIDEFAERLNEIFTRYTKAYFKADCYLDTQEKKPLESNIKVKSFIPFFDGTRRWNINRCSTSQRILLEYIFRFSLMELYTEMTTYSGFMIFETSEGAFDITNTKKLADTIIRFGKNKVPFIAIANFNKVDFLERMIDSLGTSRKKRILNFIDFSRLTGLQEADLPDYRKIQKRLQIH